MCLLSFPVFGIFIDIILVIKTFLDDDMHDCIQHRNISAWTKLQHMFRMALHCSAARIHDDQFAAAFGKLFEKGCSNRMVFGWISADHNRYVRMFNLVKGRCHGCRAHILHQSCDR